jgi:hypothetical protein
MAGTHRAAGRLPIATRGRIVVAMTCGWGSLATFEKRVDDYEGLLARIRFEKG